MQPKQPTISVIIPVYNAEHTLDRCIESVLAQSFTDWELVLVNDGSKDASGEICDRYAASDGRVRVIHKPNEGVAATRKRGIEAAKGEYSIQIDSDDWVEPTMLEELYTIAQRESADVVICDFYYDYQGRKPLKRRGQKPLNLNSRSVLSEMLEYRRISPSLANKLVRHECYTKYKVDIPSDISHGEDFFVCFSLFRNPDVKIAYQPEAYYHYLQDANSSSLTHTYSARDFERESNLKRHCLELMKGDEFYARVEERMIHNIVRRAFNGGVFSSKEFKERTYAYRHSILHNHHIAWHRRWRLYLACIGYYRLMYGYKSVGKLFKKRNQ